MKRRTIPQCLPAAVALATWLACSNADAATCSFSSVIGVAFGTYDVFESTALDSTGSITIVCSGLQPMDLITVDLGYGSGAVGTSRHMLNGMNTLGYDLFVDASRTMLWGDGSNGTVVLGPLSIANDTPTTWTVYGRIPAQQNVSVGSYSDSILVTVQF